MTPGAPSGRNDPFHPGNEVLRWMEQIAPFGIFTTDRELRIRSWNHWMATHSGRSAESLLGKTLQEAFPELQMRRLLDRFESALAGEISVLSTALHRYLIAMPLRGDGGARAPEFMLQTARIAPLRDEASVHGTITVVEDVTQRERHAFALQRQQELDRMLSSTLRLLLPSSNPVLDIASLFPSITPALGIDAFFSYALSPDRKSLRLTAAGGVTQRHREMLEEISLEGTGKGGEGGPPDIEAAIGKHRKAMEAVGLRGNCCLPLAIGDRHIGLLSFASYELESIPPEETALLQRIAQYLSIAMDRALRESEAAAASKAKDGFLAALSHELRTPLNPIMLIASDAAGNPEYPEQAREAFRVIEKNALLEARLIDDLLDITRIEHGKVDLEMKPIDLHPILSDTISAIQPEAAARNVRLSSDLAAAASTVVGDSGRLQQVFSNVLKNAVKFTPPGGLVSIGTSTDADAGEIVIRVTDTGIGMAANELARIFSAFSQGDHAAHGAHRFGGLGLGLSISRKLAELHAGRIAATSGGKDQGSTFTINLPLSKVPVGDKPGARPPVAMVSPVATRRVLLVEDHEPTRGPLTRVLERRGFQVVAAATSAAALDAAARERFDLVLSDIGLPDGDGYALMKTLSVRYGARGIALTGYGMEEDIARSRDAGFVAHLTKPIMVESLDRTLARVLETERKIGS